MSRCLVPRRKTIRASLLGLFTLAAIIAFAPTAARAAAPSLTLATGPDPTESITTQIKASGTAEGSSTTFHVTVKATGGQGCAANASADESAGGSNVFSSLEESVAETFSRSTNETFSTAGSYLLCGWLNDGASTGNPVVATASLIFTVRPPHLSLSVAAPSSVAVGQVFQIVTSAQTEVTRNVTEYILPNTGRGCPVNAAAAGSASGTLQIYWPGLYSTEWGVTGGPFSQSVNETLRGAGSNLICAYVQYKSSESIPEITASAPVTAVAPPPPCVVPPFSSLSTLGTLEPAIRTGGCSVGAIRRVASRTVRSGHIVALSKTSGAHLPAGTAITITVSTGPPCIVPRVSPGASLGRVELRLIANHCAVGKISSTRSRHIRRGRVLRLGARSGQVLASHAPIAIVIAKRRR